MGEISILKNWEENGVIQSASPHPCPTEYKCSIKSPHLFIQPLFLSLALTTSFNQKNCLLPFPPPQHSEHDFSFFTSILEFHLFCLSPFPEHLCLEVSFLCTCTVLPPQSSRCITTFIYRIPAMGHVLGR